MALITKDRVRESSTTTGTGDITLAGAIAGFQRFGAVMSIADTCWYAIVLPGGAWETGLGTYSATNNLQRTTVFESSNSNAAVSFGAGSKDVFLCLPASKGNVLNNSFPSGTFMLFQQTSAPIYWTKQVVHNDKALRVVSGTASSGGTNSFSTVMAQTVVGNTTPTLSTTANHSHTFPITDVNIAATDVTGGRAVSTTPQNTSAVGGGVAHNHTISLSIAYVDLIIASKD